MRSLALKIVLLSLFGLAQVMPGGSASGAQGIDQTRATTIKAAYLFHLASLTSWPDSILSQPGEPIRILILGPDPYDLATILQTNTKEISSVRTVRITIGG